jgi:UDP-N-acetylglucosamine--N-acetylmuramyl-(pentapeptide) pyrophosphoryl-undecaprenol N-acetylglucosamine transferase
MLPARSAEVYRHFNLDPEKQTVLILGGSGGAQSVNEAVFSWIRNRIPSNIQLLWQTGNRYYQYYRSRLPGPAAADPTAPSSGFTVFPFIDQMDLAYTCADIIVSRSGAIAISEFCLVGKPVILVPSPNVAGDHQWENARALASREAALIVSDPEVSGKLPETVVGLLGDPVRREQYGKNIRKLGIPDSADRIADQAIGLSLINKQKDGA